LPAEGFNRRRVVEMKREDFENELRRREIRYLAMMGVRAALFVGAGVLVITRPPLWALWAVLAASAALLLQWVSVIMANDEPPKKRCSPRRRRS
jgi:hypothetical protein